MKRKDLLMIAVIAIFAGIFSLVISKVFFTSSNQRKLQAETVEPISTEFRKPDEAVFNAKAINPTKLIQIGDTTNQQPF